MTHAATLQDLVAAARRAGADSADAVLISNASLHVSRRLGQIEQLERAEGFDLGLRVFIGQRAGDRLLHRPLAQGLRGARRAGRRHGAGGAGGSLRRPGRCAGWPRRGRSRPRRYRGAERRGADRPRRRRRGCGARRGRGERIRKAPPPAGAATPSPWPPATASPANTRGPAIPSRSPLWPGRGRGWSGTTTIPAPST